MAWSAKYDFIFKYEKGDMKIEAVTPESLKDAIMSIHDGPDVATEQTSFTASMGKT